MEEEKNAGDIVAQEFDTTHHKLEISSAELVSHLPDCFAAMSEPMTSHDNIGFYLLSREVARHVKVVQSGQGADEVFAGYHWYPPMQQSTDAVSDYAGVFFDRDHDEFRRAVLAQHVSDDHSRALVEHHFALHGAQRAIEDAREAGKLSYTGLTGHNPEVLIAALETGRFDTVLFVHNICTDHRLNRQLIETAHKLGVGMMLMRPLEHGLLSPDPALRFALASGVDTVLCGMYSPLEIDRNLAFAETEPDKGERDSLRREAETLSTGCLRCPDRDGPPCKCPLGIDVRQIMLLSRYRAVHGLLPAAEFKWSTQAEAAKRCDECMHCEEQCPAGLSIVPSIHEAAR